MPQDELRFQYPLLALKFPDDETFASFYPGQNAGLLTQLRNSVVGLGEPVLYMWGELITNDRWAVAIVGTRRMSPYGEAVAQEISSALAMNGITVVSGMARGPRR